MSFKLTDWRIERHQVASGDDAPQFPHWYRFILSGEGPVFMPNQPPNLFNSDVFVSVTPNFSSTDITYSFPVWSVYWRDSKLATLYYKDPCQENSPQKIKEAVDQFLDRVMKIVA